MKAKKLVTMDPVGQQRKAHQVADLAHVLRTGLGLLDGLIALRRAVPAKKY
jgi:hypothetical protein